MTNIPVIAVFSPHSPGWRWYEKDTQGHARWLFHTEEPQSALERAVKRPRLSRVFGAFRCVQDAKRQGAAAIATQSQMGTLWCVLALWLLRSRIPLVAFSFHFPALPTGPRLALSKWAFSRVSRFMVHSEAERTRYSSHFGLPIDRFDLVRWGVQPSTVEIENAPPQIPGAYICAVGKDGRDYRTLIPAMAKLPALKLIVVAQPYNLTGVDIPDNVEILCNIPLAQATNILKHCQFMALPLETNETSCGHITLVSAMFCKKAIVATRSSGISDYFPLNGSGLFVAAGDVDGWVRSLSDMASDADRREVCGDEGWQFAHQYCSHDAAREGCLNVFRKAGVVIASPGQ